MARGRVTLADGAFFVSVLLAGVAVGGGLVVRLNGDDAVASYLLSNLVIGLSAAPCGYLVARAKPEHPIGWLFLGLGIAPLVSAAIAPLVIGGQDAGWPEPVMRAIVTVFSFAWGWGVFFCLPLALQLFPTGSPLSPRWRALGWLTFATALIGTTSTGPTPEYGASSYLVSPWWEWGEAAAGLLAPIVVFLSLAALAVRYKRGDETVRQQLQWLLAAVVLALVINVPSWFSLPTGREILLLLSFALIPTAVTIAVLRYRLFDVRLALSRVLVYGTLTGIVVLAYSAIVAVLNLVLTAAGAPILAALAVALGFNPLRLRVQRRVEQALYGARRDPVQAVSAVGQHLAGEDLSTMLDALREALRLPYASLVGTDGQRLTSGQPDGEVQRLALLHAGESQGSLEIGVRRGERQLSHADQTILDLLSGPLAVALHATRLSRQLRASRDHVLTAAAEERNRLHRELHDSLGPTLTGAALKADGTALAARTNPQKAEQLATQLADQLREAIDDVRQLVYGLRPPALDQLGLIGALRRQCDELGPVSLKVHAPDSLPELSPDVEVAAYRIASEALTNVVRHSTARSAVVSLATDTRSLSLTVADDGNPVAAWRPGVGLRSMHTRAAEVGGSCDAGPTPHGGLVTAVLPLGVEP
ncbi:histidine kinase [Kribbella antiqua]|uniref:histidine kinase n=1 Tax=Kribbella antiqua TaxID=2512217 RepID=A0A4R2ID23_9ACTN|nr:histidine kinase [Kribbella antiqua]TCO42481.1 histidine kinase [Kribbella antiqua]